MAQDGQLLVVQCFTDDQAVPDFQIPYRKDHNKYYIELVYPVSEQARWQVLLDGRPLASASVTLEAHAQGEDPYQAPEEGAPGAQAAAAGSQLTSPFLQTHSASSSSFPGFGTDPSPFGRPRFKGQGQLPLSPVPMRPLFSPAATPRHSGYGMRDDSPAAGAAAPGHALLGQSLGATPPLVSNQALSPFASSFGMPYLPGQGGQAQIFPTDGATSERSRRKRSAAGASVSQTALKDLAELSKRPKTGNQAQPAPTLGLPTETGGELFPAGTSLSPHVATEHAGRVFCPVALCAWGGVEGNGYATHYLASHLHLQPFECVPCKMKTSNPHVLKSHFRKKHAGQAVPDVGMADVWKILGSSLPPPRTTPPLPEAAAAQSSHGAGASQKPREPRQLVPSAMGAGTWPAVVQGDAAAGRLLPALPPQRPVLAANPPPRTPPRGPSSMAFLPARPALPAAYASVDAAPGAAVPLLDQTSLREEGEALLFRLANINLKTFTKGLRRWPAIEAALEANRLQEAEAGLAKLRMLEATSLDFPSPAR
jgi:hypothetical protein